ncbi:MAG: hypothetical protein ABJF23_18520 [Bryobacteraceae bacterium]
MKIAIALRAVLIISAAVYAAPAHAERYCHTGMLSGDYSFRITGQILAGPLAGPNNGVALVSFDGEGRMTSKDHVVLNGAQPADEWRDSTGTYTLNANCTGKAQINFADGRTPPIVYYFILTNSKQQLDVVVGSPGSNVSVVATKI